MVTVCRTLALANIITIFQLNALLPPATRNVTTPLFEQAVMLSIMPTDTHMDGFSPVSRGKRRRAACVVPVNTDILFSSLLFNQRGLRAVAKVRAVTTAALPFARCQSSTEDVA